MWIRTCRCGRFPVRSELKKSHLRFCQISWQPEFGGCSCFNWLARFLFQYQSVLNLCLCEFNFSLFRSYYKLKQVDRMNFWAVLCGYWSQLKLMVWPRLLAFCLTELHIFVVLKQICCIAQAGLALEAILLPQSSECWYSWSHNTWWLINVIVYKCWCFRYDVPV